MQEALKEAGKMLDRIIYSALELLTEKWHNNNGATEFAEFYASHPSCQYDEATINKVLNDASAMRQDDDEDLIGPMLSISEESESDAHANCAGDTWLQERAGEWFDHHDPFWAVCRYHLRDNDKLFFNWLIRK